MHPSAPPDYIAPVDTQTQALLAQGLLEVNLSATIGLSPSCVTYRDAMLYDA